MRLLTQDQGKCTQYLCKVGLKASSIMLCQRKHTIQGVMKPIKACWLVFYQEYWYDSYCGKQQSKMFK